jgi:hypothetical protein
MKVALRSLVVVTVLAGIAQAAADPAFVGRWKFNAAKSTLTGDTATIENAPDGMMQFNSQGFQYKFKLDGKEYPMPDGGTTAWTETSADVWDVTNRMKGKVVSSYHLVRKGDMLDITGKVLKPDGSSAQFSSVYKRISGGPGMTGRWRSTEVKPPANVLEIAAAGPDGVTIKDDTGPMFTSQFDGKDSPALGRMAGSKYTGAFKKVDVSSFELTVKLDGKPMYVEVYTVAPDGKTLTLAGSPVNAKDEPYKLVFDRQ